MIPQVSEAHESRRVRHHQVGVAQSYERNEHPNPARGGVLQAIGNAIDDLLAHARYSKNQEHHAGEKDDSQRGSPWHVHLQANDVGEVRVQRHPRSQRDGIVRVQAHDQRSRRRGDAGREHYAVDRDSRLRKNLRIHHHDVGHRDERGQSAQQFAADAGLVFFQPEDAFDQGILVCARSNILRHHPGRHGMEFVDRSAWGIR